MNITRRLQVVGFILFILACFSSEIWAQTAQYQTQNESPAETKFLLYTPPSYQPGTPTPLLVCLHGAVGIGDDLNLLLNNPDQSPAWLIQQNNRWPLSRPFIVLTPQLPRDLSIENPNDQTWPAEFVDEVIEHVKNMRTIDTDRIYLTGLSLGAAGSWDYSIAYPTKLAALVPISGRTDTTQVCQVPDIPIWAFHGENDLQVDTKFSIGMVNGINYCGPRNFKPQLNLLHSIKHGGWSEVWNYSMGYSVFDWMLIFARGNNSNRAPYVNAGIDRRILLRTGSLHLSGFFFDSDGTIESVLWTKINGPSITMEDINSPMLKLSNLQSGNYNFQLQVTDNNGAVAVDQVVLEIVETVGSQAAVNNLVLLDSPNISLGNLYDGRVINKNTLGLSRIDIQALATVNTGRVRFRINSDRHSYTKDGSVSNFFLIPTNQQIKWNIPVGHYNICATPNTYGNNDSGMQGISQCFKISVYDQPIKTYYAKPNSDLSNLNSWGSNPVDGSGESPTSFTGNFQVFNVQSSTTISSPLTVGGVESVFWVRSGGEVVIDDQFNGILNAETNATVIVNTAQPISFGLVEPGSTIIFDHPVTAIPAGDYGHVIVRGEGSTKSLPSGMLSVDGDLTVDENVMLEGAIDNTSTISLRGNLIMPGEEGFIPNNPFALHFTSGGQQEVSIQRSIVRFNQWSQAINTHVSVTGTSTLQLGSETGGGLEFSGMGELILGSNQLEIIGSGSLNRQNHPGRIGFSHGRLVFESDSNNDSFIYTLEDANTISALVVDLTGAASVVMQDGLYITDSLKCFNGTVNSNGFITLLSDANKTASLAQVEGTGNVTGVVNVQRFIEKGRQYRYVGFPVAGFTVASLQNSIPVTGDFPQSSTGNGLSSNPSLFYYDEPNGGWIAFPEFNNTEEFEIGRGYSVFVRDATFDTQILATGTVHIGDFEFDVTPDPNLEDELNSGWNLLGNPYASTIEWAEQGWTATGINENVYVRDASIGRHLLWNSGGFGDEEFSGLIAQGQSFWVRTTTTAPDLTIHENAKVGTSGTFFRTKNESTAGILVTELRQNDLIDRCYLKFVADGSDSFDTQRDASKRKNEYFNLAFLTTDSVLTAIKNASPEFCEKRIPLSISGAAPGYYEINFKGSMLTAGQWEVYLVDAKLDSMIAASATVPYGFTISELADEKSRFYIDIKTRLENPVISLENNTLISSFPQNNQWFKDGVLIPEATAPTYTPDESGEYTVQITESGCVRESESIHFVLTGLEQPQRLHAQVYPNPTIGSIFIKLNHSDLPATFAVYTSVGTVALQGRLEGNGENLIKLELPLPAGLYYFLLRNRGAMYCVKLIKQ